jgi:heparanase 1
MKSVLVLVVLIGGVAMGQAVPVAPATMAKVATVDERFQSFNVEMLEVTGGRFWAPYKPAKSPEPLQAAPSAATPAGMDPSMYRYREPIDLSNPKLRELAAALGPAYIRVSGTWANSTYFQDDDAPQMKTPPKGFGGVLTRKQWKGVIDFAKATNAEIVTSFAITPGVRDAEGVWTPVEAKKFLAYTKRAGGTIAAAEMFNEPTFAILGGAPSTYDGTAYGKDFKVFRAYMKQAAPGTLILGPGSVGEAGSLGDIKMKITPTTEMMKASGRGVDGFSYHFYGGVSKRCKPNHDDTQAIETLGLSDTWLMRTALDEEFYAKLRDQYEPGKPMWLTETAETACGGDPWASTYLDSFRYLNQLGLLSMRGVQSVMHNTLAASDYALIDEETLIPRPNYWSALLWRKMMGTTVLDAGVAQTPGLYLYAHCQRGVAGGVAMLVINADKTASRTLTLPLKSERYTLTARDLLSGSVELNGVALKLGPNDKLPKLAGVGTRPGEVMFGAESITFLAIPGAGNAACK